MQRIQLMHQRNRRNKQTNSPVESPRKEIYEAIKDLEKYMKALMTLDNL